MKHREVLCIIFCIPFLLKSEYSWERSHSEPIIQNGIYALYNYDFNNAISLLDSAWKIDDTHPVTPFVLISARLLKTQTEEGYRASYKMINSEVRSAIPVYKQMIEENPDDPEMFLYLGSTYGIRARTALAGKDWLDVLYYGYQGLKYVRKAQNMDNELMDVFMPIGLMEYFSCLSPAPVKWGAKLVGLTTDCELGLQYLETAAKQSHYSWIEASNVLTYAYLHIEQDYNKAEEVISPLVEQFPGHPYFSFLKGELLAKTKEWDKLELMIPKLEAFASSGPFLQQNECQLKLAYILGLKAFYFGDYHESIKQTNWVMENYHMEFDWLKGFTHLLRGKSYDMLGKRDLAVHDYKNVIKMDKYYPEVKEAENLLKKPFITVNESLSPTPVK